MRWQAKGTLFEYFSHIGRAAWVKRVAVVLLHFAVWIDLLNGTTDALALCLFFIVMGSMPLDSGRQLFKRLHKTPHEADAVGVLIQFYWKDIRYGIDEGWIWFRDGELHYRGSNAEFTLGARDIDTKSGLGNKGGMMLGWDDSQREIRIFPVSKAEAQETAQEGFQDLLNSQFWGSEPNQLPPSLPMPGIGFRLIEGVMAILNRLSLLVIFAALMVKEGAAPWATILFGIPAIALSFLTVQALVKLFTFLKGYYALRRDLG